MSQPWTPTPGQTWPPPAMADLWATMTVWDAWWTGTPAALRSAMAVPTSRPTNHPSQYRGGIVGRIARSFWGRPLPEGDRPSRGDLHLPLASDLARTSADILYSDPPTITTTVPTAQDLITQYIEDGITDTLMGGAELGAALGGRYHRATTDPTHTQGCPFVTTHGPDEVIPVFQWGRLTAATIISEFTDSAHPGVVWRHLEDHWTDQGGYGHVRHTLYEGANNLLGRPVPLTDRPETASLKVDPTGEWVGSGLTPGLAVVYVPNLTPQRAWRKHPVGRYLGRSDIDGLTSLMDALDETWSSWMRDLRLGKARILAARSVLEGGTGGQPYTMDLDQEVFTALDVLDKGEHTPIEQVQFAIRVTEHEQTVRALTETIINQAGFSLGTFQESSDTDITATEVKAREKRTLTTRGRKAAHEKRALTALLTKMLAIQQVIPVDLTVTFPEVVQENPLEQAVSIAAVKNASLMSMRVGVQLLHPSWDASTVDAEVAAIRDEMVTPIEDPTTWHPDYDDDRTR